MVRGSSLACSLALVLTACGGVAGSGGTNATGSGGSTTTTTGTGATAPECPNEDSVHLFVDGAEVMPLKILGGDGTGTPPEETEPDRATFLLSSTSGAGEQEALVYMRALGLDAGIPLAQSSMEYRVYAAAGPPSTDVHYEAAALSGSIEVAQIAKNPGEIICGTFDLQGHGSPSVHVTGGFHHVWPGPAPGGP